MAATNAPLFSRPAVARRPAEPGSAFVIVAQSMYGNSAPDELIAWFPSESAACEGMRRLWQNPFYARDSMRRRYGILAVPPGAMGTCPP